MVGLFSDSWVPDRKEDDFSVREVRGGRDDCDGQNDHYGGIIVLTEVVTEEVGEFQRESQRTQLGHRESLSSLLRER